MIRSRSGMYSYSLSVVFYSRITGVNELIDKKTDIFGNISCKIYNNKNKEINSNSYSFEKAALVNIYLIFKT